MHLLVALAKRFQPDLPLPDNVQVEVIHIEVLARRWNGVGHLRILFHTTVSTWGRCVGVTPGGYEECYIISGQQLGAGLGETQEGKRRALASSQLCLAEAGMGTLVGRSVCHHSSWGIGNHLSMATLS